jgi:hypothetical protein
VPRTPVKHMSPPKLPHNSISKRIIQLGISPGLFLLAPLILQDSANAFILTKSESRIYVTNIARNFNTLRMKRGQTYHCQHKTSDKTFNPNTIKFKCDIVRIGALPEFP